MIEFFSFLVCFGLIAVFGTLIIYLGVAALAAFLLLSIYNRRKKSDVIKNLLSDVQPFIGGIGLFVVCTGILLATREPIEHEASKTIIEIVKFVGFSLISALVLSPLAVFAYSHLKHK